MTPPSDGPRDAAPGPEPGADEPLDALDRELLATLASAAETFDPVPAGFTAEVQFQLSVAALHAEVATLSATQPTEAVRGELAGAESAQTDTLTFTAGALSVMIGLTALTASTVRVDGWVTVAATQVRLRPVDPTATEFVTTADDAGRFVLAEVPRGTVQLVLSPPPGARPVITPRFEL